MYAILQADNVNGIGTVFFAPLDEKVPAAVTKLCAPKLGTFE